MEADSEVFWKEVHVTLSHLVQRGIGHFLVGIGIEDDNFATVWMKNAENTVQIAVHVFGEFTVVQTAAVAYDKLEAAYDEWKQEQPPQHINEPCWNEQGDGYSVRLSDEDTKPMPHGDVWEEFIDSLNMRGI